MTPTDRTALATELLAQLDTLRALHRLAAQQEARIRATWAALQAADAEQAAQVSIREEA